MSMMKSYDACLGDAVRACGQSPDAPVNITGAALAMQTYEVFRASRILLLRDNARPVDETFGDSTENEQTYDRAQTRNKRLHAAGRAKASALMQAATALLRGIANAPTGREAQREACRALVASIDRVYESILGLGAPEDGTKAVWYVKRPVLQLRS